MKLVIIILTLLSLNKTKTQILDTSHNILAREKRSLIFNEGVNWVQMIVGLGIPIEVKHQSVIIGIAMKAFYLLPTNASQITMPTVTYARKKRSTRWITYSAIENYIERSGYGNGKVCLLRTICEAAAKPLDRKSGILAEIVHAILTPSSTRENIDNHLNNEYHAAENIGKKTQSCDWLFPECPVNIMERFSEFLK